MSALRQKTCSVMLDGNISSTNCSLTTASTGGKLRLASNVALSVVVGVIAVTSILGNSLVIATVAKTPSLQRPANLMLCSLSLSDLFTGFAVMPLFVATRLFFLHVAISVCVYQTVLSAFETCYILFGGASCVQICVLSWDRYQAVSRPLVYRAEASTRKTLKAGAITWLTWIAVSILLRMNPYSLASYLTIMTGCLFVFFPAAMQVVTYKAIRNHSRQVAATNAHDVAAEALAREKKVLTTLRFVLGALAFCIAIPLVGFIAMVSAKIEVNAQSDIVVWLDILVFLNSSINPLIYFLRHADMRMAAIGLIKL